MTNAYSMLGFMMRICIDFNDASVFKTFYFLLVRSKIEFAAVVCNPNNYVQCGQIQNDVQAIFLTSLRNG